MRAAGQDALHFSRKPSDFLRNPAAEHLRKPRAQCAAMAGLTREQLESYIASLDAALARGVRSVTIGGQTVTYNSAESLRAVRDGFQRQLNGLTGTGRSRVGYLTYGGRG